MLPNFSIRQIEAFRHVMETGSVSAAARALGRTQPAVSAAIAALEDELGFALFERRNRRLIPCPEAHYFLEEADAIVDRLSRAGAMMREIGDLERGRLRIACMPAAAAVFMPRALSAFMRGRDKARAALMMRSSPVVYDLVATQHYDIGLAELDAPRDSLQCTEFAFECVCAVPASHPLAEQSSLTPEALDGVGMAALYRDHAIRRSVESAFAAAGVGPRIRFELQTFLPALQLVAEGLAVAVCDPISAASFPDNRVALRPFAPAIPFRIGLLRPAHRPPSRLAALFHDELGQALTAFVRPCSGPN